MKNSIIVILILVIIILVGAFFVFDIFRPAAEPIVSNFKECLAAGNPVAESYPRQCRTSNGEMFREDIGNELEKDDLIRIESPRPNAVVVSPLVVKGVARGTWFFEASFPVKITDADGNVLGQVAAQAQGDWMTPEFVPFTATLEFKAPAHNRGGFLVLEKDNPSGLPEKDDMLKIPIAFTSSVVN